MSKNFWLKTIGLTALTTYFLFVEQFELQPALIHTIANYVKNIGLSIVFIAALFELLTKGILASDAEQLVIELLEKLSFRGFLVAFAYATVLRQGDMVHQWIIQNEMEATGLAVAIGIILCLRPLYGIADTWSVTEQQGTAGVANGYVVKGSVCMPAPHTARDKTIISVHEAGHALVYAALGALPLDFKLVMHSEPQKNGNSGYVTRIVSRHALQTKSFSEWQMLCYLAGQEAERKILKEVSLGSAGDRRQWWLEAKHYLVNGLAEGLDYNPEMHPVAVTACLEELRRRQCELLQLFFSKNIGVLNELIQAIAKQECLNRDDLLPFMRRVVFPDGFPRPLGSVAEFSDVWPYDSEYQSVPPSKSWP
jgi:hypothetical protein